MSVDLRISRRGFLRTLSIGGGLLAVAQLRPTSTRARAAVPSDLQVLSRPQAEVLTAIAERMVGAEDAGMPAVRDTGALFVIDQALLQLDANQRSQFLWLLPTFDWGAMAYRFHGKRFLSLAPDERDDYLRAWATSRLATCRLAFRALKNLSMLGYYSQDATWPRIHYSGPWVKRDRRVLRGGE